NLPEHIRNLAAEYDEKKTLKEMLEDYEQQIIQVAYEKYRSTVKMSQALGIGQSSAVRKLQKYIKGYKDDGNVSKNK
ncbi:MAG: hypothetical protein MJA31_16345, partial [Clostridia bacterium]|nr:hypothetical protein [Clostridia bacterium]